jgi:hypothetical protein
MGYSYWKHHFVTWSKLNVSWKSEKCLPYKKVRVTPRLYLLVLLCCYRLLIWTLEHLVLLPIVLKATLPGQFEYYDISHMYRLVITIIRPDNRSSASSIWLATGCVCCTNSQSFNQTSMVAIVCERVVVQWDRQGRMRMILKDQVWK